MQKEQHFISSWWPLIFPSFPTDLPWCPLIFHWFSMVFPLIPYHDSPIKLAHQGIWGEMWGAPHSGSAGFFAESDGGGGSLSGHGSTRLLDRKPSVLPQIFLVVLHPLFCENLWESGAVFVLGGPRTWRYIYNYIYVYIYICIYICIYMCVYIYNWLIVDLLPFITMDWEGETSGWAAISALFPTEATGRPAELWIEFPQKLGKSKFQPCPIHPPIWNISACSSDVQIWRHMNEWRQQQTLIYIRDFCRFIHEQKGFCCLKKTCFFSS